MNTTLKLRKIGNSYGVILPKEALAYFNVKEGDSLSLTKGTDGSGRLAVSDRDFEKTMETFSSLNRRYRHTLRELAK